MIKNEENLLATSHLIEFEWEKETKVTEGISMTIQLTRHLDSFSDLVTGSNGGQEKSEWMNIFDDSQWKGAACFFSYRETNV